MTGPSALTLRLPLGHKALWVIKLVSLLQCIVMHLIIPHFILNIIWIVITEKYKVKQNSLQNISVTSKTFCLYYTYVYPTHLSSHDLL